MDAGEMNLSDKLKQAVSQSGKAIFKNHCFPDIFTEQSVEKTGSDLGKDRFQPYVFEKADESASQISVKGENVSEGQDAFQENGIEIEKGDYANGFMDGEKQGIESERKKNGLVIKQFQNALEELNIFQNTLCQNAEKCSVELALAVAEKIVGKEINKDQKVVLNIVKEALKKVIVFEKINIRVNPDDLQLINDNAALFQNYTDNKKDFSFESDPSISRGGCIIETDSGIIDARIEKQLQMVNEAFRENSVD